MKYNIVDTRHRLASALASDSASEPNKFQNKYRTQSTRLQYWDYGWNANYFVTICTQNRKCFFGKVEHGKMQLSEIGKLAQKFWLEIPFHFQFVNSDIYVIMPNHVHGIIVINKPGNGGDGELGNGGDGDGCLETRRCLVSTGAHKLVNHCGIGGRRFQNQGKNTLSSIIGSYKSIVTRNARKIYNGFAWQSSFYDIIIRDDGSFERIKTYIIENPLKWDEDRFRIP